jgi:drug/metabolite transporter (DMT)-like permease
MRVSHIALALLGAVLAAFGQISFKFGADGRAVLLDFMNVWIALGFTLYLAGTICWIFALSAVPLTALYPFTALTFVLVNVFAVMLLGEHINARGIVGTTVVLLGLFLISTSNEVRHAVQ